MRLFGFDHAVTAGQAIEPMFRTLSYHPANRVTPPTARGECAAIVEHLDYQGGPESGKHYTRETLINSKWPSLRVPIGHKLARQSSAMIKQAFLDCHVAALLAMTNKSASH